MNERGKLKPRNEKIGLKDNANRLTNDVTERERERNVPSRWDWEKAGLIPGSLVSRPRIPSVQQLSSTAFRFPTAPSPSWRVVGGRATEEAPVLAWEHQESERSEPEFPENAVRTKPELVSA